MKNETEIKIKISVDDNTDLDNLKPTDKLDMSISHDNCGNAKLDAFADDVAKLVGYVFQQYNAILMEGKDSPINKEVKVE